MMNGLAEIAIVAGRANEPLADSVAEVLGLDLVPCTVKNFPDDEIRIEIHESMRGRYVYIIQSLSPPVAEHIFELLMLEDACRRAGAEQVVAVLPYFGYARQDRRSSGRQPVSARLVADLLSARFERVVSLDVHNTAIEGFFSVPMEHLTAMPLLVESMKPFVTDDAVLVAPDLGAVKLAEQYATRLNLPVAYIHKIRKSGKEVSIKRVIGDVKDRKPILVDDMISTGGTLLSAMDALLERGCKPEMMVAVSHALFADGSEHRFNSAHVHHMFITDSIYHTPPITLAQLNVVRLNMVLAEVIQRLYEQSSLKDFLFFQ